MMRTISKQFHTVNNFCYDFGALLLRFLRKKIVLSLIVGFSFLYCVLSLINNSQSSPATNTKSNIYDYEFAFLKRQHNLKEILNDSNDERHKLLNKSLQNFHNKFDDIEGGGGGDGAGAGSNGVKCRNSIQGKLLIADDRGYVCLRKSFGVNGCCLEKDPKTKQYSCQSCQDNGCCSIYEYCISCCMSPSNRRLLNQMVADKKSEVFKIFMASITDHFELCLTKCRTSSSSVQHENTYLDPVSKHCYKGNF